MSFLFGTKKSPQEMLRENQRQINRSIREMERERTRMERQEKKVTNDIKREAKTGNQQIVRIMAKDLVRTRKQIQKLAMMKVQLQAVSLQIQELKTTESMAQAMRKCAQAMGRMNKQLNLPAMQKVLMEFEKQSEIMDMKGEMMSDVIDSAMDEGEDEEEAEEVVNKVLDELGLSLQASMVDVPMGVSAAESAAVPQPVAAGVDDDDLQARLDKLRRA